MIELFNPFWCLSRNTLSYTERQIIKSLVYIALGTFFSLLFLLVVKWSFSSVLVRLVLIFIVFIYMPNLYTALSINNKLAKYPKLNPFWFSSVVIVNFKGDFVNTKTELTEFAVYLVWACLHCLIACTLAALFTWDVDWCLIRVCTVTAILMYVPNLVRYSSLL